MPTGALTALSRQQWALNQAARLRRAQGHTGKAPACARHYAARQARHECEYSRFQAARQEDFAAAAPSFRTSISRATILPADYAISTSACAAVSFFADASRVGHQHAAPRPNRRSKRVDDIYAAVISDERERPVPASSSACSGVQHGALVESSPAPQKDIRGLLSHAALTRHYRLLEQLGAAGRHGTRATYRYALMRMGAARHFHFSQLRFSPVETFYRRASR